MPAQPHPTAFGCSCPPACARDADAHWPMHDPAAVVRRHRGPAGRLAGPGRAGGLRRRPSTSSWCSAAAPCIGHTASPHLRLSVLATAIVALALRAGAAPARARSRAGSDTAAAASPYDVLSRFSEAVTGALRRPTSCRRGWRKVLAEGTGAQWAQVWLMCHDRSDPGRHLAADAGRGDRPARQPTPGRHGPRRAARRCATAASSLGVLRLQERPGVPLTPVEERLFAGLAAQAGLVLRLAALRAELEARRVGAVGAGRRAAGLAGAARRHPRRRAPPPRARHPRRRPAAPGRPRRSTCGSPRRLAAARRSGPAGADGAGRRGRLGDRDAGQLSRGIYPRLLGDAGRSPRCGRAVGDQPGPGRPSTTTEIGRPPPTVEAALYFCCMEAVQNAAKHAGAHAGRRSRFAPSPGPARAARSSDDGVGFDPATDAPGAGLGNMRDRIDALGGRLGSSAGARQAAPGSVAGCRRPGAAAEVS